MTEKTKRWVGVAALLAGVVMVDILIRRASVEAIVQVCCDAFGELDEVQKDSIREIVAAFDQYGDGDKRKLAYILATCRHESNFRPIKERRARASQTHVYNLQNRYWHTGYYGRGFVQLTWQRNYEKMSKFLGVDLVSNPDLALKPTFAAKILVYGMMNGSFTRRKLADYIAANSADFYQARKTVNGLDKAALIQNYTLKITNQI